MRIVLKMIVESDDVHVENETELVRLDRGNHSEERPPELGMTMKEAKSLLVATQRAMVLAQSQRIVEEASHCACCGAPLKVKDRRQIVYRTLFGKMRLSSPRLSACPCRNSISKQSLSPLANVLKDRSHPELLYLTTRWASIVSYGTTSILLADVLPIDDTMSCSSIRNAVVRIGQRMDERTVETLAASAELERKKLDRAHRVETDHPLAIELDAGYIRSTDRSEAGSRWFSATVARLVGTEGAGVCHAFVGKEVRSPAGRLDRFLSREGIDDASALAVISDGGEDMLGAGYYHYRASQQLLDWFHIAMRFQHVWQALGSIDTEAPERPSSMRSLLEHAKWRLWHFQSVRCLAKLGYLRHDLEELPDSEAKARAIRLLQELVKYLYRNEQFLGDYASRYRAGLPISSASAESVVNCVISKRFVKKQQMRWSATGANALLQIRCAVLNGRYWDEFSKRDPIPTIAANDPVHLLAA